jgi:Tfp pilus assembly protein FimT
MRRAHTLMELLVVLTLLVLAAGIAAPKFLSGWASAQLNSAASSIRNDLAFARTRAIASGVRHQVLMDRQRGAVVVQPFRPEEVIQQTSVQGSDLPVLDDELPEQVRIVEWTVEPFGYAGLGSAQQIDVLTFYAEGRSDSALVVLEGPDGEQRGIELNGFTGEISELNEAQLRERSGSPIGGRR